MFSVIIPAYNAEKFIMNSIQSVLNQTYEGFELIVVDDGSKDGTKGVIERFKDDRLRYVYQENAGVSAARNRGILESKYEFICFLDADDEWRPEHLSVMSGLISKYPKCGMYISGYDIRLNNGELIPKSRQILRKIDAAEFECDDGFELLNHHGYFFNTNVVCCRREAFDKVGVFSVGVRNGEDDDMWYRIFAYYPIAVSKASTTVYDRANCGATGKRVAAVEPPFVRRVDGLLASPEIPQNRKQSLVIWSERNMLSQARKHIINGNKSEAFKIFRRIAIKKVSKKKYFETLLCMFVPTKLIQNYIDRRDRGYYQE